MSSYQKFRESIPDNMNFFSKRELILVLQISVGFFPVLLFGSSNYQSVENFYARSGLLNAYFFGVFMNSSVYLVSRYQSSWRNYFFGNLFGLFAVTILVMLLGRIITDEFNPYICIIALFMSIKNSVHSIGLTLGLYRSFFLKELFSVACLGVFFVSLFYYDFNEKILVLIYFLYTLPSLGFVLRLFRQSHAVMLFDYSNWFSGYLDPLASGLLITVPRLLILDSEIVQKDSYLLSMRLTFAIITLGSQFFWIRTTRELSKEFFQERFIKAKGYLKSNSWLLIVSFMSLLCIFVELNLVTFTLTTLVVFSTGVVLITFLRYKKSVWERSIFFALIALILSLNIVQNYQIFVLSYLLVLLSAFLYLRYYINRYTDMSKSLLQSSTN